MTATQSITVDARRVLFAAIAAIAVAGAGLSLSIPLLALRMESAGYSATANGIGIAVAGLSTLVFAPFVPALAAWMGVQRFLLAALVVAMVSLLGFAATEWDLRLWYPMRGIYSCALTGLFVISEYAVNALAPPARRGVWIGIYSTGLALGFAAGPLMLGAVGSEGLRPFIAGTLLFAVAGIPLALAGRHLPGLARHAKSAPLAFLRRAPGLMSAAFVFGAVETGAMGLLPVHAVRNGMSAETGALLVAALAAGNILSQVPLGYISDKVSRRLLLLAVSAFACVVAIVLAAIPHTSAFLPTLVVWSGVTSGLYMVGLAELGARYKGNDLATANAVFVGCYATGMIAGPPLAGRAVDLAPTNGLFLSLAVLCAMTLLVQAARLIYERAR